MFGYGHFTQIGASAYVCALFQGIMMAGVLLGTISSVSYALDAYRESSNELFIMNMLFKNFMFYGISYVANDWVVKSGPMEVMAVCGLLLDWYLSLVCLWLMVVCFGVADLDFWEEVEEFLEST
jgi:hypothetical protein